MNFSMGIGNDPLDQFVACSIDPPFQLPQKEQF